MTSLNLDAVEARVLGCLIEKDLATPDYYPMSLGALTQACNQKSNREPVMNLQERQVAAGLDTLGRKYLVWERNPAGSRVTKYAHRLSNTLSKSYDFSPQELAILGVLLLRGPQTPGELRARTERLARFESTASVEEVLARLAQREDGPYVLELARSPGHRETRYVELFSTAPQPATQAAPAPAVGHRAGEEPATAPLQEQIESLRSELAELRERVAALEAAGGPTGGV